MASTFIKAERIVRTALGLLEREIVLPRLVWRDAGGDFRGAKNDTISIRLPAYASARKRDLRGGTPITMDELTETKVDVTLDSDIYKAVPITDEELSLDIEDFGFQVLGPSVRAVARGVEDEIAALMSGGDYVTVIEIANTGDNPVYDALIDARKALNNANVPMNGRGFAVGSDIEAKLLKSPNLVKVDQAGSDSALREAMIGRIAGFDAVISNSLAPDEAYAFHRTAYVLSTRAPMVPEGATFGASESFAGLAMRVLRDYDFVNVRDRLLADLFVGTNIVEDNGSIDANGKFIPNQTPGTSFAVTSVASTDLFTKTAHGLVAGDVVTFDGLTGGAGLVEGKRYFVIAAGLTADVFAISETSGGASFDHTTNVTAGTAAEGGLPLLVRAVKLTDAV